MAAQPTPFPSVLKHYRLDRELGRGAMGAVYAGEDRRDGTRVAVKLLHSHLGADEEFRTRFEREAHVAALLRSPYTVHLLDFGLNESQCYLVMEFIDGSTLADVLKQGPMEPVRAMRIAIEIGRALEESGARGVVHRDIKPENILIDSNGRVKVTDFGIARQSSGGMTSIGVFVGTPAFAAPEQAEGAVDARADIYALGATLYAMLSGQPPFRGTTIAQILQQHRSASLPMQPLSHLPDAVANVVRRCMEKDPRDRYANASELVGALERATVTLSGTARATAPVQRPAAPPAAVQSWPEPQAPAQPARPMQTAPSSFASPQPPPAGRPPEAPTQVLPPAGRAPAPPPVRGTGVVTVRAVPTPGAPPPAIRMALVPRGGQGRGPEAHYELSITNDATGMALLRLVPNDPAGTLQITIPARAAVTPGATVLLEVSATTRLRRTSGTDRQLTFFINAFDETSGQAAGSASTSYSDVVARRNKGYARLLALALAGGTAVAAAAAGGVAFFGGGGGGGDGLSGDAPERSIRPGVFNYNLVVDSNDCNFGAAKGTKLSLSFRFDRPGKNGFIEEKNPVMVTFLGDNGTETQVGRSTFEFDGFTFTYDPAKAGEFQGHAEMVTAFKDESAIAAARYTESYELKDRACTIVAKE